MVKKLFTELTRQQAFEFGQAMLLRELQREDCPISVGSAGNYNLFRVLETAFVTEWDNAIARDKVHAQLLTKAEND